ncbi:craniofacial development protein 1 [Nephila pilipes]|uniref:Craniofacial development protein 1 n=1 Tax=Nephila pilipes TaxID=299642 RepID=A0A8X6QJP2_NEPPI|nr:craniofacial development protein 1 [Nephila pilipes]
MASIIDVSVSSDSEDDIDYVPPQNVDASDSWDDTDDDNLKSEINKTKSARRIESNIEKSSDNALEMTKVSSGNDEKNRTEDLWKSFLSDVSKIEASKKSSEVTFSNIEKTSVSCEIENPKSEKVPVSKIFEFAEEIYSVDKDSSVQDCITKQNDSNVVTPSKSPTNPPKKRSVLDSVLGTIRNKKQKVTVLQKSLHDWNSFKKSEGIQEDLEKFNKGKQGFIERQRFLQRTDVRSFDIEKDMRQSLRKK